MIVAKWNKPAWTQVRPLFRAWWDQAGGGLCCENAMPYVRSWALRAYVDALSRTNGTPLFKTNEDGRTVTA